MPAGELSITPGTPAEPRAVSPTETGETLHALSRGLEPKDMKVLQEPDGAILNSVAISRLCFKMLQDRPDNCAACSGASVAWLFGASYSHENPPPSFIQAKKIMSKLHTGNTKHLKGFFKDGWWEVPSGQRWGRKCGREEEG